MSSIDFTFPLTFYMPLVLGFFRAARYVGIMSAAFIEILRGLWDSSQQPLNHKSDWYSVVDGEASPIPYRQPQIANAGTSADAQSMTARLCDWAFIATTLGMCITGPVTQRPDHLRPLATSRFLEVVARAQTGLQRSYDLSQTCLRL